MTEELRTRLHRVADSAPPMPVADDLWRRGRAARRRGQVLAVAAALAIVVSVGGVASLVATTDREARTASSEVGPEGAVPSRIEDPGNLAPEDDLVVGTASVAFVSESGATIVIGAATGTYHHLALPDAPEADGPLALSPDGRRLAWSNRQRIHVVDLESGEESFYPNTEEPVTQVTHLAWVPNSGQLLWNGIDDQGADIGGVLPVSGQADGPLSPKALRGIPSPSGDLVAVTSPETVTAARFLRASDRPVDRSLPTDLYPAGASIAPLGWAAPHLVLAELDAPAGSYVEGHHLVLLTSPDRPESEWTLRIVARDIPQNGASLSVAVDLIPDLDGTSSQELTHDFGESSVGASGWVSQVYALAGVLAVLSGLFFLATMGRRAR